MDIEITWQRAVALPSLDISSTAAVLSEFESVPGIYLFARRWGSNTEILYVGQAENICRRLKQQLNNHKLIQHVLGSKTGAKVLIVGYLATDARTNVGKRLDVVENALLRLFLAQGHDLHNKKGTRVRRHRIISLGVSTKNIFPKEIGIEE